MIGFPLPFEKTNTSIAPSFVSSSALAIEGAVIAGLSFVARTLIEEGIRLAIKDGLLSIRDNGRT
mgnify:CR=1 FL=1